MAISEREAHHPERRSRGISAVPRLQFTVLVGLLWGILMSWFFIIGIRG
jgi:hypothetical protein